MNRRGFLGLSLAGLSSCRQNAEVNRWKGIAMGIEVSVQYRGDHDLGPALKAIAEAEEALSLWSQDSALSRLNESGRLDKPPKALLECLQKSRELFEATNGLFDPSIHSFLQWSKSEYESGRTPSVKESARRLTRVDFARIDYNSSRVTLPSGMSLGLNALAQGYLTDVFAENFPADSALVYFGEHRVIGKEAWPVELRGGVYQLTRSLAVSSGSGERLSATSAANHLIDPKTGKSPPPKKVVAVEADEAWLADGLSTVVALGGAIPARYPGARILV